MEMEFLLPGGRLGRRALAWVLVLSISVCMGLLLPRLGDAHAHLTGSSPKPGETLTEVPSSFSLEFDEPVEAAVSHVLVVDAQGAAVEGTALRGEGNTLFLDVPALAAGEYTLVWEVLSADGHLVDGEIPFAIAGGAAAAQEVDDQVPPDAEAVADPDAEPADTEPGDAEPVEGEDVDQAPADDQGGRMNWIWYLLALVLVLLILRGRRPRR